jgi:class 3 adenylate cyclase
MNELPFDASAVGDVTFDAVVGFIDLAGFTSASEVFSRDGARGTERLVSLINSLFTPALEVIEATGGEVLWFAGDAMGVAFDTKHTPPSDAAAALIEASRRISALPSVMVDGREIHMAPKVGVARGDVRWQTIGTNHLLPWFGGPAIELAVEAEHQATVGEVVVHRSVELATNSSSASAAAPHAKSHESTPSADHYVRIRPHAHAPTVGEHTLHSIQQISTPTSDSPNPLKKIRETWLHSRRSLVFQPSRVVRFVELGEVGFIGDHRTATVLFARFPYRSHTRKTAVEIEWIAQNHDGLLSLSEGDKGATAMVVFGAPVATPDREAVAFGAALALRELDPQIGIGIATGRVFAGPVGSRKRWDYSVIGDRVNVAARLMQAAANGEILVDGASLSTLRDRVIVGEPRLLDLKGKSESERVEPLVELKAHADSVLVGTDLGTFVGREIETATVLQHLEGPDALLIIVAEAGTGKSRLLHHVIAQNRASNFFITWLEQVDRSKPFSLWARLFARLEPNASLRVRLLPQSLRADDRLPILNPILGTDLADSVLSSSLGAEERADIMATLLTEILESVFAHRTIVVEDLYWSDPVSLELLSSIAPRLRSRNVHIVATTRPNTRSEEVIAVASVLELGGLEGSSVATLASQQWLRQFGCAPSSDCTRAC